jgi:hypothetical protein
MDEDTLRVCNVIPCHASQKRPNQLGENSHSLQPSRVADGENEFDDEPLEEDELISDNEDSRGRRQTLCISTELFKHFVRVNMKVFLRYLNADHFNLFIQRAHDLEHAQPKSKGRGQKSSPLPYEYQLHWHH